MPENLRKYIGDRKIALFGGFRSGLIELFSGEDKSFQASIILSNSDWREGSSVSGITVVHPKHIEDWSDYYVIVLTNSYYEVRKQLQEYGLKETTDFVRFDIEDGVLRMSAVRAIIEKSILKKNEKYVFSVVRNQTEYEDFLKIYSSIVLFQKLLFEFTSQMSCERSIWRGKCPVCNSFVNYTMIKNVGLRENAVCPECQLNSRQRALFEYVTKAPCDSETFIYEQTTPLYEKLCEHFCSIQGSEYLDPCFQSGSIHHDIEFRGVRFDNIMHQDALKLSFPEKSFDIMISADVMEHVGDYKKAFQESYRCLRTNGRFVSTIPVFLDRHNTIQRSIIDDNGIIRNYLDNIYHDNPLCCGGSLVFSEFGWDILDELKNAGFLDAYFILCFSTEKAFFSNSEEMPVLFLVEARK